MSKLHYVKAYRRPEGKAACDILVDSGYTFQNFRVVELVARQRQKCLQIPDQFKNTTLKTEADFSTETLAVYIPWFFHC